MISRYKLAVLAPIAVMLTAALLTVAITPAAASITTRETASYYEDALIRFNKLDYAGAVIQLRNVLQQEPGNLAARILLGKTHLKLGAAPSAQKELEIARKAGADEELIIADLANAYLLQGKHAVLVEKIQPGGRSPSVEAQVLTARASAHYELFRYDDALAEFDRAITLAPRLPGPLLGKARVLIRQGKFDPAQALVEAADRLDSDYYDVWYIKGELHRVRRQLDLAVKAYDKALAKVPNHAAARISRATSLIDLGRHEEAIRDLDVARRLTPTDPQPHYLMYLVYGRMGDRRKSLASLRQADQIIRGFDAEFVRSHGPTLLLTGVIAMALEKPGEARYYLSEYIKLEPNNPGARRLLGGLLMKEDRAAEAVKVLRPILDVAPNDWQAIALLGTALMHSGKAAEATKFLQQAVNITPERTSLRTRLALSRLAIGQNDQAVDDLEIALEQSRDTAKPAMLLGLVHLRLQRYDQAIAVAESMIERHGDNALAYNLMGGAQLGTGDRKAARSSFEKALELVPDYQPAQSNLARLDFNEGQLEAAKARYRMMLQSAPQAIPPMVALSSIAEKEGNLSEAIQWLEKVGSFKRKDIPSQLHLIDLYHQAGRAENALFVAVRLKQQFASNLSVLAAVGKAELKTGAVEDAVKTFRRMANMRPDSATDLLRISRLQTDAKDFKGAFNTLRRAVWVAPDNFEAQQAIVKLDIHMGRLDAARERAEELGLRKPNSGIGDRLRGDVMMAAKNYPAAVADYQASIDKNGGDTDLAIRVYLARFKAGQVAEAITVLEAWVTDNPNDIAAQRTLAAGYITVERLSQAILAHEKLLAILPNDGNILNNLAWLYHETGDKRALAYAQKAYGVAPNDASVIDTLGWILVKNGKAARGLTLLRQASARAARQPRIRYHLATALAQLGRLDEARGELRTVIQKAEKNDPDLALEARQLLDTMGK